MYSEQMTNRITWAKPDPPPSVLHTAFTHAHETLLWASKGKSARHTCNYDLPNSPDPSAQLSSVWAIPAVPMKEKLHGYHPTRKPLRLLRRAVLASTRGGWLSRSWSVFRGGGDGAGVRRACGAQDRCCGTGGSAARTLCPNAG